MIIDDMLFGLIMCGFVLSVAYIRSDLLQTRGIKRCRSLSEILHSIVRKDRRPGRNLRMRMTPTAVSWRGVNSSPAGPSPSHAVPLTQAPRREVRDSTSSDIHSWSVKTCR